MSEYSASNPRPYHAHYPLYRLIISYTDIEVQHVIDTPTPEKVRQVTERKLRKVYGELVRVYTEPIEATPAARLLDEIKEGLENNGVEPL